MKNSLALALSVLVFWGVLLWFACRKIEGFINSGALEVPFPAARGCPCPPGQCKCCGCDGCCHAPNH